MIWNWYKRVLLIQIKWGNLWSFWLHFPFQWTRTEPSRSCWEALFNPSCLRTHRSSPSEGQSCRFSWEEYLVPWHCGTKFDIYGLNHFRSSSSCFWSFLPGWLPGSRYFFWGWSSKFAPAFQLSSGSLSPCYCQSYWNRPELSAGTSSSPVLPSNTLL